MPLTHTALAGIELTPVPDAGSTLLLASLGMGLMALAHRRL